MIGVGTFGCGSVIVEGEDFIAENITFENSAPEVKPLNPFFIFDFFALMGSGDYCNIYGMVLQEY